MRLLPSERTASTRERRRSPPKSRGAGVAAVGFRVGACDAALGPRPPREIAADIFFPTIGVRAKLNRERVRQGAAGPLVAAETTQKIGENAIPGRLTHNPLISLETAKEKVWKSLEKLGISLEFLWKSLEILEKAWGHGDTILDPLTGRRPPASGAPAATRLKIAAQTLESKPSRRKMRRPRPAGRRKRSCPAIPSEPGGCPEEC